MSIRQIILTGLLAGETTAQIATKVQAAHPGTAAAEKSSKHIAFYRCQLKKAGKLPAVNTTEPETPAFPAELVEKVLASGDYTGTVSRKDAPKL